MDVVGFSLQEAAAYLERKKIAYDVERTFPTRDYFQVDSAQLYVIRQKLQDDARCVLTVAAKLRKEV